ncbi:MAG: MFS transporter [Opitutaceae bacterium]|nr:MFS transporter [Opitutaceae bacterium]
MPLPTSAPRDFALLFAARIFRLFAYGFLAVVLVLYLRALGYPETRVGVLLAFTLLGDAAISLTLTTRADRLGRRRMLLLGAVLMVFGGAGMAVFDNFWLLLVAAIVGVLSPSGNELGPFLAIEQACLTEVIRHEDRTRIFAWSHVLGFTANAFGALAGGGFAGFLQHRGWVPLESYRMLLWLYAAFGGGVFFIFTLLGREVEAPRPDPAAGRGVVPVAWHGLHEAKGHVVRLSALFTLDAFGGGFIVQSFVAYWFHRKFGVDLATLGGIFFGTTLLSGLSALAAVPLAKRFGLLNTMVFTHLPSNLLLMLVPFMPTLGTAVGVLLARHLIAQMDVPTRQSYVNAIVPAAERSAANGITTTIRQVGTALGPLAAGPLMGIPALAGLCFVISGGLKSIYDLVIWRAFSHVQPPEEQGRG